MRLEAVSVGRRQTISLGTRTVDTGIDKLPVDRAFVGRLGVAGDTVADTVNHGGPDQAVYLYARSDYAWWEEELGRTLPPGLFGENLTVSSLGAEPRPGDRLRVGAALLELTAPRIPCAVFANKLHEPAWVKRFAAAGRPGAYARVLEEGEVAPGDEIDLEPAPIEYPTLLELFRLYYEKEPAADAIVRALAAPVAERERAALEERLSRLAARA
jgi:MOSC domain-containing protein YiiM